MFLRQNNLDDTKPGLIDTTFALNDLKHFFIKLLFQVLQNAHKITGTKRRQWEVPQNFQHYYNNVDLLLQDFANYSFKVKLKFHYLTNKSIT